MNKNITNAAYILKTAPPMEFGLTRTEEAWVEDCWPAIKTLLKSTMPAMLKKPLADFVTKHFASQFTLEQLVQQPNALKCLRQLERISTRRKK